jgi:hypothetical protein
MSTDMLVLILAIPCHAGFNFLKSYPNFLLFICDLYGFMHISMTLLCMSPYFNWFPQTVMWCYITAPPQCNILNFLLSAITTGHAHFLGESHTSAEKFNTLRKVSATSWFLEEHHLCWKVPRLHVFSLKKNEYGALVERHWWDTKW